MVLKSLEISGFKSFPKKTVFEFKTAITAIVGPNGSGKSNVAEAFRFVLGEQSQKRMRSKRTEDLIWNGSSEVPRSNRASVKIIFENLSTYTGKRVFDIDFDEISIERVVHRDASNEYRLNGSQARLKDIVELITSAKIGSTGHHIISQGEADRILSVPPKDRKKMIEDALGLKIYEIRKDESERKLAKTGENLKEAALLRRELAPHLKFLSRQVDKIKKTEELKETLKILYKEYFKREYAFISFHKNRIKNEEGEPKREFDKVEKELIEARKISEAENESSPLLEDQKKLEEVLESLRSKRNDYLRDLGRLEGEIASGKKLLEREEKIRENIRHLNVSIDEVRSLREEIDNVFENDNNNLGFKEIKDMIKKLFENFFSRLGGQRNSEEDRELKEIKTELIQKEKDKQEIDTAIISLKEKEIKTKEELGLLKEKLESEKDSYREAEKRVYQLQAQRSELKAKLDDLISQKNTITLEEDEMKRELAEASVLIGQNMSDFDSAILMEESGEVVKTEDISREDRSLQKERQKKIERIKIRLEDSGQGGSEEILKEYNETLERDNFLEKEIKDLEESSARLVELIKDLDLTLNEKFKLGLSKINDEFQKFFSVMFGGGRAFLSTVLIKRKIRQIGVSDGSIDLTDEEEYDDLEEGEVEEGIEIDVVLPHKKIKGLEMLSGGERALTSIALIFAMSQVNPPPFLILDETDAALDEANSRRYGDMIEILSKESQLILITHNRETMSRAGVLYGVTMGREGYSKTLSVAFEEAIEVAK